MVSGVSYNILGLGLGRGLGRGLGLGLLFVLFAIITTDKI